MKTRILPLLLALALLTGCSSMLNREYVSVEPHNQFSDTGTDSSALRAETYQGLVNAILYLISQGSEEGVVRLYNYTRDVESDLSSACLEVAQEDPLGSYAVDYIKYDFARIVSYYEANVQITYRRTAEQIKSVVSVTGSSAIKGELRQALARFSPEVVLRVSYFVEDNDYLSRLIREAYYDTPEAAFGMPSTAVALYPDNGSQRIVELTLTYPDSVDTLRKMQDTLSTAADGCAAELQKGAADLPAAILALLRERVVCLGNVSEGWSTAYAALVSGEADSEGCALAFQLLCGRAGVESMVVGGTQNGSPCFWNIVNTENGWRHVSAAWKKTSFLTDGEMGVLGYVWDAEAYPACGEAGGIPAKNST